jgi:hypothetical protein
MAFHAAAPLQLSKPLGFDHQAQPFAMFKLHNPHTLPEEAEDRVGVGLLLQLLSQLLERIIFGLKPNRVSPALGGCVQGANPSPKDR